MIFNSKSLVHLPLEDLVLKGGYCLLAKENTCYILIILTPFKIGKMNFSGIQCYCLGSIRIEYFILCLAFLFSNDSGL